MYIYIYIYIYISVCVCVCVKNRLKTIDTESGEREAKRENDGEREQLV